jgi:GT2 family glycosyltransferase
MAAVAVQVVTYNSAATIEVCLRAVMDQRAADFQVLVIDNASADDTVARVQNLGVPIITNAQNLGYAAAHNQALAQTDSAFVLTLNPDLWLDPGYLRAMQDALASDVQIGSAAGCLLRVESLGAAPTCIDSTGLFMRRNRRQGLRNEGRPVAERPAQLEPIFGPDGAAALYRRAMLEDIGVEGEVFDADFFMHKEDVDVCWRAQWRGWKSVYVPGALAHHVRGFRPGQRSAVTAAMRFYGTRNRYLLMLKNEAPAHFWRDCAVVTLYDLGILAYVLLRERETLKAFRSAWALRGRMLHKRRIIQNGRRVTWREMRQWFRAS